MEERKEGKEEGRGGGKEGEESVPSSCGQSTSHQKD